MRLAGKHLQLRDRIVVNLKGQNGPIAVYLGCLPLGFPIQLERILPEPVPPKTGKCVKDERGDPVLLNGKPIPEVDWQNSEYRLAKSEHETLVSVFMLYTSMKAAMPDLEFDAEVEFADKSLRDKRFAVALEHEFAKNGFSLDVIRLLLSKMREINGLDGALEVADGFLSQPAAQPTSESSSSKNERAADASGGQQNTGTGEPVSGSE